MMYGVLHSEAHVFVWFFGTKSDVMVTAGRYELVHISTDATNTSRLPQADTHNEMYFFSIDNH